MISRCTSSISTEEVHFPRLLYCDARCFQTCCRCFQACRRRSQDCCQRSQKLTDVSNLLSGTPSCTQTYHNHFHGTPVPVIRDPSYSEGQPECPPSVYYSPEIDTSKFILHILSDTPGGFQWLKYILLMWRRSFPLRHIHREVAIELYCSVVRLVHSYNCVCRVIVLLFFPFSSFFLYTSLGSLGGQRIQRGII